MTGVAARDVVERFIEKTMPEPNSGCWFWCGLVDKWGSGRFFLGSKRDGSARQEIARRASYQLFRGEIPKGSVVRGRCGVTICVNPNHLEIARGEHGGPSLARLKKKISIDAVTGCWNWTGAMTASGCGVFTLHGRYMTAHRASWVLHGEELQPGLHVHHKCVNPSCVNPLHLALATAMENTHASDTIAHRNSLKTHCPQGHEYTPENTRIKSRGRACRECGRQEVRARRAENGK